MTKLIEHFILERCAITVVGKPLTSLEILEMLEDEWREDERVVKRPTGIQELIVEHVRDLPVAPRTRAGNKLPTAGAGWQVLGR